VSIIVIINMKIFTHPLREGVTQILEKHFAPEIVAKFQLQFEANVFQGQNILNQIKNDKVALEVYYDTGKGAEFICDIWSWMKKAEAEFVLLKYITDAAKSGKIGSNWIERQDGRISEDVAEGKYETKEVA